MTLDALLKMPHTKDTIEAIEVFLSVTSNEQERLKAYHFYADILESLDKKDQALNIYLNMIDTLKHRDDPMFDLAIEKIIQLNIDLFAFDEALKYIEKRKSMLPILKKYLYFIDLIQLHRAQNMPYEHLIDQALDEVLPESVKVKFLIEKLDGYMSKNQFDLALIAVNQIKQKKIDPEIRLKLELIELEILLNKKLYTEMLEILNDKIDAIYDYYWLKALIGLEKYRQASVFEVEHEYRFEEKSTEEKTRIYTILIDLYERLNDKVSIENYVKKLKNIKKVESKKEIVSEPVVIKNDIKPEPIVKPTIQVKEKQNENTKINQSIAFEKVTTLIKIGLNISSDLSVREQLRTLLLSLEQDTYTKDIVIFIHPNTLMHYKKQRLYDKVFEPDTFIKTVMNIAFERQEDIIEDTDLIRWDLDIITKQPYDQSVIKKVYTYANPLGVVSFYQGDNNDPMFYDDYYKLLSTLLFNLFNKHEEQKTLDHQKRLYQAVYQSGINMYRIVENDLMRFNQKALSIFDYKKYTPISDFIKTLSGEDQIRYKRFLSKLETQDSIIFKYDNKTIEETMVKILLDQKPVYISSYKDVTKVVDEISELKEKAVLDLNYQIFNKYAFEQDIASYFQEKTTFYLLELKQQDHLRELYGLKAVEDFFKAYIQFNQKHFDQLYIIDTNRLIGITRFNDIRTVERFIKTYFDDITATTTPQINQSFQTAMGVIRYPINTTETNLDKFYSYLSLALEKSNQQKLGKSYAYFDFQDYKEEQFEVSLIEQMDLAIQKEILDIRLSPIVHLATNKVFGYMITPYLDYLNVDEKYFSIIAKKRQMIDKYDKYMIRMAFKFLSDLANNLDKYVRLAIEVDATTIKQKEFNAFLIGLFKQNNLPYSIISLHLKTKDIQEIDFLKLKELYDLGIHISIDDFKYAFKDISFIHVKEKMQLNQLRVHDFLINLKDYAEKHQIGIIMDQLDDEQKRKLKGYHAIYHLDYSKILTKEKIVAMIEGK